MARRLDVCLIFLLALHTRIAPSQDLPRRVGKLQEVFAWRQLTYNIDGNLVLGDRAVYDDPAGDVPEETARRRRQMEDALFVRSDGDQDGSRASNMDQRSNTNQMNYRYNVYQRPSMNQRPNADQRPVTTTPLTTTTSSSDGEQSRFFIQYNNLPMGVERHQNWLFIAVPRRRYGIPATLNYVDLTEDSRTRSPSLRPYPDLARSRSLVSVYRTRVDECGRLWMVDTGRLEIPNNNQQIQPPAIVVFDLSTNRQLFRYEFKDSDLPAENTPTGLASITVDVSDDRCGDAYAYVPDLTTFGLIVYSLRENDSWRLTHNYFSFNPTAGGLRVGDQRFQWSDGIFSITLSDANGQNCRTAYFHPLISTQEFAVSTCDLKNRNLVNDSSAWERFALVGERGADTQSTMHGYHPRSRVMFYAEVGRNAVSCWHTGRPLAPADVAVLAQDNQRLLYPSDLHVTGDEVWLMANSLTRFGYSRLDVGEYNFYIYRGNVSELIDGTICEPLRSMG